MTRGRERTDGRPGPVVAAIVLSMFALALVSERLVASIPGYVETVAAWPAAIRWLLQPLRWLVAIAIGMALIGVAPRSMARELGVVVPPARVAAALGFAFACTTPMLVLGLVGVVVEVSPRLVFSAGVWPLAEELLFRGAAFGLLVRLAGWGVWRAALVTGLVFGAAHLFNAEVAVHEIPGQLLSIAIIAAGGVAFAWLYARWQFNLWVAIGLHGLMNLWYELLPIADTPIGSAWLIGARVAVVAIAIAATEYLVRTRGLAVPGSASGSSPGRHSP